jgi:hypothetical protein
MSEVPFLATDLRWGKKLGDEPLVDASVPRRLPVPALVTSSWAD